MFNEIPQSADAFFQSILVHTLSALKINTFLDNFDEARFNFDGNDHSKVFNTGQHVFYFEWFFKNYQNLYSALQLLNNDSSKILFLYLISFRLAGHLSVKLPVEFAEKIQEYEEYKKLEKGSESTLPLSGMFGKLLHFDFEYQGNRYIADCLGLEHYLFRGQYFYSKEGVTIRPEIGDHVIDGGACTGDTALVFSNAVGPTGNIYAFDPVAEHIEVLSHNIKQFPFKNVVSMPYGLSDKNIISEPIVVNQYSPGFRANQQQVPLRTIDYLLSTQEIQKIDYIKLDVEGSEMETLRGALESIKRFKPKLAISLYHKPNDIFEIILYIKDKFPFYNLYLDHYTIHQEETVLYCCV